jgi:hypothetical protein
MVKGSILLTAILKFLSMLRNNERNNYDVLLAHFCFTPEGFSVLRCFHHHRQNVKETHISLFMNNQYVLYSFQACMSNTKYRIVFEYATSLLTLERNNNDKVVGK